MRIYFLLFICFLSPFVLSAPPKFTWRIDSRKPYELFRKGMVSWGTNMNVYSHISGASCTEVNPDERTSGFISTSASQAWGMTYAINMARQFVGEDIFLYRIRADNSFYNAVDSLRLYEDENPDVGITEINYIPAQSANEYITPLNIPPGNIESVLRFRSPDGREIYQIAETNSNYVSLNTEASSEPYNGTHDAMRHSTWLRYVPFIGACMASKVDLELNYSENYPLESLALPFLR